MSDLSLSHFVNLELEDFYIALVYIFYLAINRIPLFRDFFFSCGGLKTIFLCPGRHKSRNTLFS